MVRILVSRVLFVLFLASAIDKPEEIMVKREHSELEHRRPKAYIVLKSELCYCTFFGSKTLSHICHKHLQHKALIDMHF